MDLFDDPGAYFDAELLDENNDLIETLFAETLSYYSLGLGLVCRCLKQLLVFSSPERMKKIRLQKESTDSDTVSRDLFGGGTPPSSQNTISF
jgi:hypothetical protein